jgi:hypothetical protein
MKILVVVHVHCVAPYVSNLDRTIGLAGCEDESCASDLGGDAMRGCGIPRGFWLKPGGSADRNSLLKLCNTVPI